MFDCQSVIVLHGQDCALWQVEAVSGVKAIEIAC